MAWELLANIESSKEAMDPTDGVGVVGCMDQSGSRDCTVGRGPHAGCKLVIGFVALIGLNWALGASLSEYSFVLGVLSGAGIGLRSLSRNGSTTSAVFVAY